MADETVPATTDAIGVDAFAEHYPLSAALEHTLFARRDAFELWRTVAKREGMQQRNRVGSQILRFGHKDNSNHGRRAFNSSSPRG